mmetsp:Transcript_24940/g.50665  ORF Transcript_24940/g.50665 Transcript_24940/m.50665 type:complete len:261 (-) Transcript_24940:473-1255(-)
MGSFWIVVVVVVVVVVAAVVVVVVVVAAAEDLIEDIGGGYSNGFSGRFDGQCVAIASDRIVIRIVICTVLIARMTIGKKRLSGVDGAGMTRRRQSAKEDVPIFVVISGVAFEPNQIGSGTSPIPVHAHRRSRPRLVAAANVASRSTRRPMREFEPRAPHIDGQRPLSEIRRQIPIFRRNVSLLTGILLVLLFFLPLQIHPRDAAILLDPLVVLLPILVHLPQRSKGVHGSEADDSGGEEGEDSLRGGGAVGPRLDRGGGE